MTNYIVNKFYAKTVTGKLKYAPRIGITNPEYQFELDLPGNP